MNISIEVMEKINEQIAHELKNSQIYTYLNNYCDVLGYSNIAKMLKSQADGEKEHQYKLVNYCNNRNEFVRMLNIDSVEIKLNSLLEVAELVLKTEQLTTAKLKDIYKLAFMQLDLLTVDLIGEMLKEQTEEEALAMNFRDQISRIGNDNAALQLFDNTFEF